MHAAFQNEVLLNSRLNLDVLKFTIAVYFSDGK